jgi:hypothetical protein
VFVPTILADVGSAAPLTFATVGAGKVPLRSPLAAPLGGKDVGHAMLAEELPTFASVCVDPEFGTVQVSRLVVPKVVEDKVAEYVPG